MQFLKKIFAFTLLLSLIYQYTLAISPFTLKEFEIKYPSLPGNIEPPQEFIFKINCQVNPGDFSDPNNPCLKIRQNILSYNPDGLPVQTPETESQMQERLKNEGYTPANSLPLYFKYFFHFFIIIAISICAIIFIYAGILYLSSTGKPARLTEARIWMQSAITGLIIILSGYAILYAINPQLTIFKPLIQEEVSLGKIPSGPSLSGTDINFIPLGAILDQTIKKLQTIRERAASITDSQNYTTIQKAVNDIYETMVQLQTSMQDLETIAQQECSCGRANCIQAGEKYIPDAKTPCNPSCDCKEEVAKKAKEVDLLKEELRLKLRNFVLLEIPLVIDYLNIKTASFLLFNAEGIADQGYFNYYKNSLKEAGININASPVFQSWPQGTSTPMGSIFIIQNIALLASTTNPADNATTAEKIIEIVKDISKRGQDIDQHLKTQISGIDIISKHPTSTAVCNVFVDSTRLLLQEVTSTAAFIKQKINGTDGILDLAKKLEKIDTFKIFSEASKINLILGYIQNRADNIQELLGNLQTACRNKNGNEIISILYKIQNIQFFYLTLYNNEIWGPEISEVDYATFFFNPNLEKNKELIEKTAMFSPIACFTQIPGRKIIEKYKKTITNFLGADFLDLTDAEWQNISAEVLGSVDGVLDKAAILQILAEQWSKTATKGAIDTLIQKIKSFLGGSTESSGLSPNKNYADKKIKKIKETFTIKSNVAFASETEFLSYVAQQYITAISSYLGQKSIDTLTLIGISILEQAFKDLGNIYPFFNPQAWQSLSGNISNVLNSSWTELIPQLNDILNSQLDQILPPAIVNYMQEISQGIENFIQEAESEVATRVLNAIHSIIENSLQPAFQDSPWLSSLLTTFISAFDTFFINYFIEALDVYFVDKFLPISPYSISTEIGELLSKRIKDILPQSWTNYLNQSLRQSLEQCGTPTCYNIISFFENAASTTLAVSQAFNSFLNQLEDVVSSTPNTLADILIPQTTQYWNTKTIYQLMRENESIAAATDMVPKNVICNIFTDNNICFNLCKTFSTNVTYCENVFPASTCDCFTTKPVAQLSNLTSQNLYEITGFSKPDFFNKTILEIIDEKALPVQIIFDFKGEHCTTTVASPSTLFNTPLRTLANNFYSFTFCDGHQEDVGLTPLTTWLSSTSLYNFIINNVDASSSEIIKVFFDKSIKTLLEEYINSQNLSEGQKQSLNKFINFFTSPVFNLIDDENVRKAVKEGTIFDLFSDKGNTPLINLLSEDFRIMVQLIETYDLVAKGTFPQVFDFFNFLKNKPWKDILLSWSCNVTDPNTCNWFKLLGKSISWDILFLNAYYSDKFQSLPPDIRWASSTQQANSYYNFLSEKSIADFFDLGFINKSLADYIQINLCKKDDGSPTYQNLSQLFKDNLGNVFQNCWHKNITEIANSLLDQYPTSTIIQIMDNVIYSQISYKVSDFDYLLNTPIGELWPLYILNHNLPSILASLQETDFLCQKLSWHDNVPNLCGLLEFATSNSTLIQNCYAGCDLASELQAILNKSIYNNIIDHDSNIRDRFEKSIGYWIENTPPFSSTIKDVIPDELCVTTSLSLAEKLHATSSCQTTSDPNQVFCCVPLKSPLDQFFNFNLRDWATSTIHDIFVNYLKEHPEELWENIKPKAEEEISKAIISSLGQILGGRAISTTTMEALSKELASTTQELLKDAIPNILQNGIPLNSLQNL